MSIDQEIDNWISTQATTITQNPRQHKAQLYAKGLKHKLEQAEYSLSQIKLLSSETGPTVVTIGDDEPPILNRIHFHCDAYFAFLYSAVDILGQVINQARDFGHDEDIVNFATIENQLSQNPHTGTPLQVKTTACNNSITYGNIKNYRNCSTHRRPICIWTQGGSLTEGYTTTAAGPFGPIERYLCDNPLDVTPRFTQQRKIPDYMTDTQKRIHKLIGEIVKNLTPV